MAKKKKCPKCGEDLTNKAYIGVVYDGKVARLCVGCANEVLKSNEKGNRVNRNLNSEYISERKRY